ncbi:MAG: alpha/beta hydrolase [Acidobacteriales bacterium]|nr:alpha/beta hydrolase [Terriglobales bacterium]
MLIALILASLLSLGVLYQLIGTLRDARNLPPPGRIMQAGRLRLHLNASGSGSPVVVLDSGIAASSLSWVGIQAALSQCTTVCSYDRAGFAWSGSSPGPRTPHVLARELHAMLTNANLQSPYVLVGHSFGGLIVRAFAAQFPGDTAGLVLVDALSHREWLQPTDQQKRMLQGGVLFSRIGVVLAAFGVVRLCLALLAGGSRKAPQAVLKGFGKGATALVTRIVGEVTKLPREVLPAIRAHWSRPKSFATMARYLAALPASSAEFSDARPLPDVPLIVLSAQCAGQPLEAQKELASLSSQGEHRMIPDCGHWVHLDRPDAVIQAVKEVLERVRIGDPSFRSR